jgi:hypothetical protein
MRIWDIPPKKLCRNHFLGQHRELHAIWSILVLGKKGYAHHPETLRWKGKLKALYLKHLQIEREMKKRGYKHKSPLDLKSASGNNKQTRFIDTISEQIRILKRKKCSCNL